MSPKSFPTSIEVLDLHTEGEPLRMILDGWPEPEGATMAERRSFVERHHDDLRRAVISEPRGHDAIVGALITPAVHPDSIAGIVFFNNVGTLGMCGHGLIGVVRGLAFLGKARQGLMRFDTPVGTVAATLEPDGAVTIDNVPAYCSKLDVELEVPELGTIKGDVVWGGNWFFLTRAPAGRIDLGRLDTLLATSKQIQAAVDRAGITGDDGPIDHVELFGAPVGPDADSRNFVLCPGGQYDRSPCGTGTSAKLAALYARGEIAIGQRWQQESVTGSRYIAWLTEENGALIPHVRGRAFVTGRTTLYFDPADFFRLGIGPEPRGQGVSGLTATDRAGGDDARARARDAA